MRHLALALSALLSACGSEASVGDASCTDADRCAEIEIAQPLSLTVLSTRDLPERVATKVRSAAELGLGSNRMLLAGAPSGGVWVLGSAGQELIAKRLDAEGNVLGEQRHGPPAGLTFNEENGAWWSSRVSHALGPVAVGQWNPLCATTSTGQPLPCVRSAIFVFENDATTPPRRIDNWQVPALSLILHAYRSQRGDALYVPLGDAISMLDLQGRILWTRSLPRDVSIGSASAGSAGTVLDNGSLVLSAKGPMNPGYLTLGQLLVQPMNGEPSFLQSYLATIAASADSYRPAPNYESTFSLDARGRRVMAHEVEGGDLVVVRADAERADGWRIRREDFLDVSLVESTTDSAGTLYLTGAFGPRGSANAFLCRFPMDGAGECWKLSGFLGSLQAPTPGVLFATGADSVYRYDF